jgi:hypothetical protein
MNKSLLYSCRTKNYNIVSIACQNLLVGMGLEWNWNWRYSLKEWANWCLSLSLFLRRLYSLSVLYSVDESKEERKKRPRTAFTASQVKALEAEFERNKYLSVAKRASLAKTLKLTETQVSQEADFSSSQELIRIIILWEKIYTYV